MGFRKSSLHSWLTGRIFLSVGAEVESFRPFIFAAADSLVLKELNSEELSLLKSSMELIVLKQLFSRTQLGLAIPK